MIHPETIEVRPYVDIVFHAWEQHRRFGVVAATASGKTYMAYLLADDPLASGLRVLMTAPTSTLCEQHAALARRVFRLDAEAICLIPGRLSPKRRAILWAQGRISIATPQTLANDIERGIVPLDDVGLVIIDECHHAAKTHASIAVAQAIAARDGRLVGLTASPGSTYERIERVRANLHLAAWIDIADEETSAFRPPVRREAHTVPLPPDVRSVVDGMENVLERVTGVLARHRILERAERTPSLKCLKHAAGLKELPGACRDADAQRRLRDLQPYLSVAFQLTAILTSIVSDDYRVALARIKRACTKRWKLGNGKPGGLTRAARRLRITPEVERARELLASLAAADALHPKQQALLTLIGEARRNARTVRGLIYNRFAAGCRELVELLNTTFGANTAVAVLGQQYMRPADAIAALQMLADGTVSFVVATDVIREGVHIPAVDLLVLYSPPRNAIELIQLEGRTGRTAPGTIVGIVADHPADSRYTIIARTAAARMRTLLERRVHRATIGDGIHRSRFSGAPEKPAGSFVRDLSAGFVFERFRVEEAHVIAKPNARPYARFVLADRTGRIPCFHWCPDGLAAAERIVSDLTAGTIVITAGIADEYRGDLRITINPREGQHLTRCPDEDLTPNDYIETLPF
ncbi:MAG: helicase-related protein [bacterium]|nr:helicase-related protein [bacterium]